MATVSFIPYKAQSRSALHRVMQYVGRDDKTEAKKFVSGIHCTPQLAYHEFTATREMHHKQSPVWFYHYTQSFSPQEHITPELAHELAGEFAAKAWPESEVIFATHVDREHIHTHFIVNAVCYESGKMLRQGPDTLFKLRKISDELCMTYGLSVLKDAPKHGSGMDSREYRSAVKGESWKFQVINAVDLCMCRSRTKKEFIENMKQLGYGVRWEDGRKNITYTHPCGRKVRDEKLHNRKYLKARMEHEFRIREEIISGRIEEAQYAAGTSPDAYADAADYYREYDAGGVRQSVNSDAGVDPLQAGFDAVESRYEGVGGRYTEANKERGAAPGDGRTGWEEERADAFAAAQTAQTVSAAPGWANNCGAVDGYSRSAADSVVRLGRQLEQSQYAAPMNDSTMRPAHIDRKRWKKLQEKRIANGHKEDDHEEEQTWQQTMF